MDLINPKEEKGKVECNLEEFPYFIPSTKNLKDQHEIIFVRTVQNRQGETFRQEWIVRAEHGDHLPGSFEADVKRALDKIVYDIGFQTVIETGIIKFSLYQIAEILGLGHGGWTWQRIRKALERMKTTNIHSKQSFYLKGKNVYVDDVFSYIDNVRFYQLGDESRTNNCTCQVKFSKYYIESLKGHYIKPFDFGFYWSLGDPIPKRLYSLFDKRSYTSPTVTFDLIELGKIIPLTKRPPSKIRQCILPGLNLLKERGYLVDYSFRKSVGSKGEALIVRVKGKEDIDPEVKAVAESIFEDIVRNIGVEHRSEKFYRRICEKLPRNIIYRALSEVREEEQHGQVQSKIALFTTKIKRFADEADIPIYD